jgi:hypothetical protein
MLLDGLAHRLMHDLGSSIERYGHGSSPSDDIFNDLDSGVLSCVLCQAGSDAGYWALFF